MSRMVGDAPGTITRPRLRRAARLNPSGVLRLAKALGLRAEGMSARQAANLIWWRLSRSRYR